MLILFGYWLFGLVFLLSLERKFKYSLPTLMLLGSAFPFSTVIISLILTSLSILRLQWSTISIICILLLLFLLMFGYGYNQKRLLSCLNQLKKYFTATTILIILMVTIGIIFQRIQLNNEFIHADGLTYWFLRGTIFYQDKGVSIDRLNSLPFSVTINNPRDPNSPTMYLPLYYPLLVPENISLVYLLMGQQSITTAKWLWLGIEWSLILCLVGLASIIFNHQPLLSFLPIILLYTIPSFTQRFAFYCFGFADTWLSLFWLLAIWFTNEWLKSKLILYWWLSIIMLSAVLMTKIEGLPGLILLIPLYYLSHPKKLILSLPFIIIPLWWLVSSTFIKPGIIEIQPNLFLPSTFPPLWVIISHIFILELSRISVQGIIWWLYPLAYIYWANLSKNNIWQKLIWSMPIFGLGFVLIYYIFIKLAGPTRDIIPITINRYAVPWQPITIVFLLLVIKSLLSPIHGHRGR